ncbi:MAG: CIA30 family protein [Winogradskyella sp.]|uniref:CIA30 family protein n=1 Tax=Winogradskyella sp. TaxID=1883156 RepID=UPI001832EA12|nr:CIA30 family protein [Winogradskyella sp.]
MTLFNFTDNSDISNWKIVDDGVMGGKSYGNFALNRDGHGIFTGNISLKNNGGFSSVHYYFDRLNTKDFSKFIIRIKGDGKPYQFRVKDKQDTRHSYVYKFTTTGNWQTVTIPFSEMQPSFRGYKMTIPNFNGAFMEEVAFLIGNKKEEQFELLINSITLE